VLDRDQIAELLTLHSQAYQLLMWLGEEAVYVPTLLGPSVVKHLQSATTAGAWLVAKRDAVPTGLVPDDPTGQFANLFASFFATSFRVKHLEFNQRVIDSRLTLGIGRSLPKRSGTIRVQALALKHLASSVGIRISEGDARRLVTRDSLRLSSHLWTYVWELNRRAKGKAKGDVVHALWRQIPWETKKELTVAKVWEARELLVMTAQNHDQASADDPPV
jgi:hypothetical protein